jgi:hypothetical protein
MKVKKIGNVEEQPQVEIPKKETQLESAVITRSVKTTEASKKYYYIIGGILLLIIVSLLIYIFAFKNSNEKTETSVIQNQSQTTPSNVPGTDNNYESQKEKIQNINDISTNNPKYDIKTAEGVVVKFIESLGKQDFSSAFALMTEKRRGSYNIFSSKRGYGGITSTKVFSCIKTGEINNKYEVRVNYESIDPANKSGKFEQYFYLIPFNDSFLISEIKNINIQYYDEGD